MRKKRDNAVRAKAEFERVTEGFEMTIEQDDGVHRCILFRKPNGSCGWYRLVTWPGSLCIRGDYGTFVFSRLQDMFQFFRSPTGSINPDYWAEKIDAANRHGGAEEWSRDLFVSAIVGDFREYWQDRDRAERRECFRELRERVLGRDNEQEAMNAAWGFQWKRFNLGDFYEHRMTEPTFHYLWCLHAIVGGIQQYDEAKQQAEAA